MKRGTASFEETFQILIAVIIFAVVFFIPVYHVFNEFTSGNWYERDYLALDLSLVTETILASPNDIIYIYDQHMDEYSVRIMEDEVQVFLDQAFAPVSTGYYIDNPGLEIYYNRLDPLIEEENGNTQVIPMKLAIVRSDDSISFYDIQQRIINE